MTPPVDGPRPDGERAGSPRVAIAHDYLTQRGGAERVVLAMIRAFPDATVHTLLYDPDHTYPEFRSANIVTSPLDRVPLFRRDHRLALPLMRSASARLRVEADVVLISSSGWAHGFDHHGLRLVYCHAPPRWVYQSEDYLGGPVWRSAKGWALAALRGGLRRWDVESAARADRYLCNSQVVHDRVLDTYGIEATVVPPPFGVDTRGTHTVVPGLADDPAWREGGHLLVVSRLLPYKHVDRAIDAVRGTHRRLLVVGHGPEGRALERSRPDNVRIVGHLSDAELRWAYSRATVLIAPSHEDFGLTPLEAAAYGKPTAALRGGGYLDTVVEGVTGVFFDEPTGPSIRAALERTEQQSWDPSKITHHASGFAEDRFAERLQREVADLWRDSPSAPVG